MKLGRAAALIVSASSIALAVFAISAPSITGVPALRKQIEDQGRRVVEALNSTDTDLRKRALRETYMPSVLANDGEARMLAQLERVHSDLGNLELHHSEVVEGGSGDERRYALHVYAKAAADGRWRDLQFRLDPAPPHRIQSLVFIADVAEPIYLPNGDLSDPATRAWLDGYVDRLIADNDLAGSLLIARGDEVIFDRSFGYADSARRRPIGPHTRFSMASGGKMFTALCIARLVERGKLRFEDSLSRVAPKLRNEPFARGVTVAQLLSHTSGIGEYWTDDYVRHRAQIRTLTDFLPFVRAAGTKFAPGERFEYSNSNYILAGLVLEAVSGKPYDQVLRDEILKPLGLKDTGLFPYDVRDTLQAMTLRREGKGWAVADRGVRGSSAGGCLTTASDMQRFARALADGKIVSAEMLSTLTTSKTVGLPDVPMSYGYGFILESTPGGVSSYGHAGIAPGMNFELRQFSPGGVTLVAFSNQDNGAYDDLVRNAKKLVTGQR
jgi:CubicO group peptidase (beta-lactamase class C family)